MNEENYAETILFLLKAVKAYTDELEDEINRMKVKSRVDEEVVGALMDELAECASPRKSFTVMKDAFFKAMTDALNDGEMSPEEYECTKAEIESLNSDLLDDGEKDEGPGQFSA